MEMNEETFCKLVEEIRQQWRNLKDNFKPDGLIGSSEEIIKNVELLLESADALLKGYTGEEFVEKALNGKVDFVCRTKKSETPADVWAWSESESGGLNVYLIQVKSSESQPEELTKATIEEFELFTKFVLSQITSRLGIDGKTVRVHNSYIGIILNKQKGSYKVKSISKTKNYGYAFYK